MKPADVITVHVAGGHDLPLMNSLATGAYTAKHARRYAEIVRERSLRRQVILAAIALQGGAYEEGQGAAPVADLVDHAMNKLLELSQGGSTSEPRAIGDLLVPWIDDLTERAEGRTDAVGLGLIDCDRLLAGGLRPGEVMVIGARPSMGKSALALTIARSMSRSHVVLGLSLEDSENMLISRHVAAAGRINLAVIRKPEGAPDSLWSSTTEAVEELRMLNLYIDDAPALTLRDVRLKAQQVRRRAGRLDVLMLDYLQLMEGDGETRSAELTAIARGVKRMAKELKCRVILLSQLSREADKLAGPPRLDHLAESGGIEQAADIIGLLWREARAKPKPGNKHEAQIEWAKNKNGPTGTVKLYFDGATQRFADYTGGIDHE
jgi:replicative DNA helicase